MGTALYYGAGSALKIWQITLSWIIVNMEHYIESEHALHILKTYIGCPDLYAIPKHVTPAQTESDTSKAHNKVLSKRVKLQNKGNLIRAQEINYMLCLDFYVKKYYKYA